MIHKQLLLLKKEKRTPLDEYVAKPDPSYKWQEIARYDVEGCTIHIVNMTSQSWMNGKVTSCCIEY